MIHLRLSNIANKAKNCEHCVRQKHACQFIWERDDSAKRTAESGLEPESSKRVKIDVDNSKLFSWIESIDRNVGALIKISALQARKTGNLYKTNTQGLKGIRTSLHGIKKKYI